jgi:hypothetical protein
MDDATRSRMALTAAAGGGAGPGASQAGPFGAGRNPLATLNPTQLQVAPGAGGTQAGAGGAGKGGGGNGAGPQTQRGPRLGGAELEMQDAGGRKGRLCQKGRGPLVRADPGGG